MYKVQGSWDGIDWEDNQRVERSCGKYGHDFENLEAATHAFNEYVKTRPFRYRRMLDGNRAVVMMYKPKEEANA